MNHFTPCQAITPSESESIYCSHPAQTVVHMAADYDPPNPLYTDDVAVCLEHAAYFRVRP